ncbi:MAG: FAD-dependent oxidoreductase [candidate division NC10 bacterium]
MDEGRKQRILILGGGFGGVYTAMELEKLVGRDPDIEIALVNKENYFVFQPMLAEVISGSVGIVETITPIRRLCPRVKLYIRQVEYIDLDKKVVVTSPGFRPRPLVLPYDHLVLALGNTTNFAEIPGLQEHAIPFKYLGDALLLRNHVINALEEADIETDPDLRSRLLSFVVSGGGFAGVEVVAELNDFVREVAKGYRHIDPAEIRVVLLQGATRILPELSEDLAEFAHRILERRKVEIRLNSLLAGGTGDYALLKGGERILTKTLVSTVPAAPNPLLETLPCGKERGRIVVDEFLEVPGYPGVWAVGDCAWIADRSTGKPCPPTAQHAIREGRCLARNIVASLRGQPKSPFSFSALGKMGALGHRSAVAEVMGIKLSGFLAWCLWRSVYLMKLPGVDRKLRVAMDWFLDLFLAPDIVQLKTARSSNISRQHFNPGDVIFEEGDLGDQIYFIIKGEVEISQEEGAQKLVLSKLGPGDCFGEMALVERMPRMATARGMTALDVLTLDRAGFDDLFAHAPQLRTVFSGLIETRRKSPGSLPV